MKKNQGGFTLVEVIVVAGIIAILAGVLIPLVLKEIDESRISRAYGDIRSISTALLVFRKDTGKWQNLDAACTAAVTLLKSDGTLPANIGSTDFDQTAVVQYSDYVTQDLYGCYGARWKGPYAPWINEDPWGNAYITNANAFAATGPVWILSAGPNGDIDTSTANVNPRGDDVGIRIK